MNNINSGYFDYGMSSILGPMPLDLLQVPTCPQMPDAVISQPEDRPLDKDTIPAVNNHRGHHRRRWTFNQEQILFNAINRVREGARVSFESLAEEVNKLAIAGDGIEHTPEECKSKINKLKLFLKTSVAPASAEEKKVYHKTPGSKLRNGVFYFLNDQSEAMDWSKEQIALLLTMNHNPAFIDIKQLHIVTEKINQLADARKGKKYKVSDCIKKIFELQAKPTEKFDWDRPVKRSKSDLRLENIDYRDQVTPMSAIATELPESNQQDVDKDFQFDFNPLPLESIPTAFSEQEMQISTDSSWKRKISAESTSSQPKKVKVDHFKAKTSKQKWSSNQLKAVGDAIIAANFSQIDQKKLFKEVNDLAAEGDGDTHTKSACRTKVLRIRDRLKLEKAKVPVEINIEAEAVDPILQNPVDSNTEKKKKAEWSFNQMEAVKHAIKSAGASNIKYEQLLKEINDLADKEDGSHHNLPGCKTLVFKLRAEEKRRQSIDPAGTMTDEEIANVMKRPIEGQLLAKLIELHEGGVSYNDCGIILGKSGIACELAYKKYLRVKSINKDEK